MAKVNLTLIAILLAGCASHPPVWNKDGATSLDFAQDKYQCAQETASSGNYTAFGAPLFVAIAASQAQKRQGAMYASCMEAHGWVLERTQ